MDNDAIRFGVNYVPRERWWHAWVDWDETSVSEDLRAIARLGMDHVRVHLLWPVFQPDRGVVSRVAVARLRRMVEIASAHGLDVCVAVLDGWLSGFEFYPGWLGNRSMFHHPEAIEAERLLFQTLAEALDDLPNVLGFDLGNELGVLMSKSQPATPEIADAWQTAMLAHCEAIAPGRLHVNGVDHAHWFADHGFTRSALATTGAMTTVHSWTKFTGALERYGGHGVGSVHLAEYQTELAKAYHTDPHRKVWVQEIGASKEWMPEASIPDFAEASLKNVASCQGLWGVTWWCSHDLNPELKSFGRLEYDLGLIDAEGKVKPLGRRVEALIREFRTSPPAPLRRNVGLILRESDFSPLRWPIEWTFAASFMRLVADGVRPSVVLEGRADDVAHLRSRGIDTLVDPAALDLASIA